MQHIITPKSRALPSCCWWQNLFSDEELDHLNNLCSVDCKDAVVGASNEVQPEVRRAKVNWLSKENGAEEIFERLSEMVSSINAQHYGFDLTGFGEPLQLTTYSSENEGMYTWHQDTGGNISRKLSVVVQLSDPCDYEGGQLQIWSNSGVEDIPREKGLITIFPCWTMHQVTPVTSGQRKSLVCWISGPDFI